MGDFNFIKKQRDTKGWQNRKHITLMEDFKTMLATFNPEDINLVVSSHGQKRKGQVECIDRMLVSEILFSQTVQSESAPKQLSDHKPIEV